MRGASVGHRPLSPQEGDKSEPTRGKKGRYWGKVFLKRNVEITCTILYMGKMGYRRLFFLGGIKGMMIPDEILL